MNSRFNFKSDDDNRIVYVRPVDTRDLPDDVREHTEGQDQIYAVHAADGQRLALVKDRALGFHLARENDLSPVNVH
jgi:hypothetical protein